jgi:LytS/YehU family sensor histidine kinase
LLENEKLKREKLKSDYKLLQDQINPHFLFNSFNVLISEISHDPSVAKEFATKLSQVYRYVLQSNKQELVQLKEELIFLESYIYLHEIRIGDALKFKMHVEEDCLNYSIPPLTLQILVENAIKHNAVNQDNLLNIVLRSEENCKLILSNNLNPKSTIESTKTGLMNIRNRYKLLGDYDIQVDHSETHFTVTLPLLDT